MRVQLTVVLLAGALLAAAPVGTTAVTQVPSAAQLAQSLQKRYATIRDFKADFTHEVKGAVLRTVTTVERGDLKVKKPGRLWMSYTTPQKKSFVADGTQIYTYNASDRAGTQGPMPAADDMSVAILFLAGRGDLVKDFKASMPATQPAGEWQLVLTPLKRQPDFATLTLAVDRTTLAIRGMTTVDAQGGTFILRFTNLQENIGLKDTDFRFTFPRGTNVIYGRDQ
jgi:outer membrane lipoprotein carrier protein